MEPTFVPEVARRFAIGFMFLTHIQFAAFIIGTVTLAVTFEFFHLINRGESNLERLSHGMGKTAIIMYSTGAVFAFGTMFLLSIFWPVFWNVIVRVGFWALFLEAITFALTLLFLFPWYFTWHTLGAFRWVHLSLGSALVISVYFQQMLIDVLATYMLTPSPTPLALRVFFNATSTPLTIHRLVGNISFVGFLLGGFGAFMAIRARTEVDRAFYDWVGSLGLVAGLGFLYLQPAIGVEYMMEIRAQAPEAFSTMMRGSNSWLFLLQVFFLGILFLLSMMYIILQVRKSGRPGLPILWTLFIVASMGALLSVQPFVIGPSQEYRWVDWANPVGTMQPWKYIGFAGVTLSAIFAVFIYVGAMRKGMRWGYLAEGGRSAQYLLLVLAIFGSFMMALMGFIRENSRIPYIISRHITIDQPEQFPELLPTPGATYSFDSPASGFETGEGGGAQATPVPAVVPSLEGIR